MSFSFEALRKQFPNTFAAFSQLPDGGSATIAHLYHLDRRYQQARTLPIPEPDQRAQPVGSFDVVLAGGGLSLIYAAFLSMRGLRVAVFDRRAIGCGHREWNISRKELIPLSQSGLFSEQEVAKLILLQYRTGICRFGQGTNYAVSGVLDCVVDAETLLARLRARCLDHGVTLLPHRELVDYSLDARGVTIRLASTDGSQRLEQLQARLMLDGLGATSPHARFDLCCPTVGGVMDDLAIGSDPLEMDPEVGEILVTTEGIEQRRQHIWEGFPTVSALSDAHSTRRMTIYLFYYLRSDALSEHGPLPLLSLYERYFETLPRYKRGPLRLVRPTYGYIPAYTRLGPMPASPCERVFLVGDAAGRHSPLTFCGFGSMIRSFLPIGDGLLRLLARDQLDSSSLESLWQEPPALKVLGGLTLMMSPPLSSDGVDQPDTINELLNAAFSTLYAMGEETYRRFLQDDVDGPTFVRFMLGSAQQHPEVYRKVFRYLSLSEVTTWLYRLWQLQRSPRSEHETH